MADKMFQKVILGFVRVHILYHAAVDEGIYGLAMIKELGRHGYELSPGTLYPILHEMEAHGYLVSERRNIAGKIRRVYKATTKGVEALKHLKAIIKEMFDEVV